LSIGHTQSSGQVVAWDGGEADQPVCAASWTGCYAREPSGALLDIGEYAALTADDLEMGGKIALSSVLLIYKRRNAGKQHGSGGTASNSDQIASGGIFGPVETEHQAGVCGGVNRSGDGQVRQEAVVNFRRG
jgi:hypothetical protein